MKENNPVIQPKQTWLSKFLARFMPVPKDDEALIVLLRLAKSHHILSAEALNTIERILQVANMQVREIMIPKSQMIVINQDDTLATSVPCIAESGHSRFPVVNHANTEVVGILLAKDLLNALSSGESLDHFKITNILRAPLFTPQSKRLDILLREFRINHNHMAIVLDEYCNVS